MSTPVHHDDPVYQRAVYSWWFTRMWHHLLVGAALGAAVQLIREVL